MVKQPAYSTKNTYTDSDLAVRSVRTNSIATPGPTTCRDMSACITLIRTETTLSCAWSWHSDPRAATEAGEAEQVADISATGRRKPRPGYQLDLTPTSTYSFHVQRSLPNFLSFSHLRRLL
jgi:hypothetical protein